MTTNKKDNISLSFFLPFLPSYLNGANENARLKLARRPRAPPPGKHDGARVAVGMIHHTTTFRHSPFAPMSLSAIAVAACSCRAASPGGLGLLLG
jgi:hypothetical protein